MYAQRRFEISLIDCRIRFRLKEGGLLVDFTYSTSDTSKSGSEVLAELETKLRSLAQEKGGLPTWSGFNFAKVWTVRGTPWREVTNLLPVLCAVKLIVRCL